MFIDGFGCLHTEDVSGHKKEGLPFLQKNPFICLRTAGRERQFGGNPLAEMNPKS